MYIGNKYYARDMDYQVLSKGEKEQIHSAACRVLVEQGMMLQHPGAVELLKKAGATVKDENIVYLPVSLVEWAIKQAPSLITLFDRDSRPAMFLEKRNVYYGPGSDTPYLMDYEDKGCHNWRKEDIVNAVKVCDSLENIDFVMSMGIISDVHFAINTREQYAAMIRNTTKPMVVVCDEKDDLEDVFRMFIAVRGSKEELRRKPYAVVYNEPTSPRIHTFTAIDKLILCAEYGVPSNYATGGMAGATTPLSAAGSIVLATAECLFGLVIYQLTNPGGPFVFGTGNSPIDMKTVQSGYALPLGMQIQWGMCDMSHYYDLPSWGEAGHGCAKMIDEQSAIEAMHTLQLAAFHGCNITHDVGYMNFGLGFSLENLVLCDEMISRVKEIMKGVEVNKDTLAVEAIDRVGFGGDFLREKDTLKQARSMWRGELSDFYTFQDWERLGKTSMGERAHKKVKDIIENYKPVSLNQEVDQVIEDILTRKRLEITNK